MPKTPDRTICILGLGYIGLPTAAVLASRGYDIHGVEVNPKAVATINEGMRNKQHGFALIELLVVLGIITLLVGLLLPALSHLRAAAQRTA